VHIEKSGLGFYSKINKDGDIPVSIHVFPIYRPSGNSGILV